jgi:hypothetical protein
MSQKAANSAAFFFAEFTTCIAAAQALLMVSHSGLTRSSTACDISLLTLTNP